MSEVSEAAPAEAPTFRRFEYLYAAKYDTWRAT